MQKRTKRLSIAIVGGGFCGVAAAWHLLQIPRARVTLFDKAFIGAGASGAACGLLHPYLGKNAFKSVDAKAAIAETQKLLQVAQKAEKLPVANFNPILRYPKDETQKMLFQKRAAENDDLSWQNGALWIRSAATVFSKHYLRGLWRACKQNGARFVRTCIQGMDALPRFDITVLAVGKDIAQFAPKLPLKYTKGQILVAKKQGELFTHSLMEEGHIALTETPKVYHLGSTYERRPTSLGVDLSVAKKIILPKIGRLCSIDQLSVMSGRSGVRVAPNVGHYPCLKQLRPNVWIITGMGSRGLLYHALFAKQLKEAIE